MVRLYAISGALALSASATATSESCTLLSEPPMITEGALQFSQVPTTVSSVGVHTLGVGILGALGQSLDCIAKVTTVTAAPAVCSVTVITNGQTTYPCSTATTFTSWEKKCKTPNTYCWRPTTTLSSMWASWPSWQSSASSPSSCTAGEVSTSTVTETETATVTSLHNINNITSVTATSTVTVTVPITVSRDVEITTTFLANRTVTVTPLPVTITEAPALTTAACLQTQSLSQSRLSCDQYGYLIQTKALYRVDISSGKATKVTDDVGSSGAVNAMGYNVLDNYLYGYDKGSNSILRISADGASETVAKLGSKGVKGSTKETFAGYIADIDTDGHYWYAGDNTETWYEHDLLPGSPTYGQVVSHGTCKNPDHNIGDWVYLPTAGRYLWAVGGNAARGGVDLMRWSLDTHVWEVVQELPDVPVRGFGALYGVGNGTLFGSDNQSGQIWAFDTTGEVAAHLVSYGPKTSSNDGARCVLNELL